MTLRQGPIKKRKESRVRLGNHIAVQIQSAFGFGRAVSAVSFSSVEQLGDVDHLALDCINRSIVANPQPIEILPTRRTRKSCYVDAGSRLIRIFPESSQRRFDSFPKLGVQSLQRLDDVSMESHFVRRSKLVQRVERFLVFEAFVLPLHELFVFGDGHEPFQDLIVGFPSERPETVPRLLLKRKGCRRHRVSAM